MHMLPLAATAVATAADSAVPCIYILAGVTFASRSADLSLNTSTLAIATPAYVLLYLGEPACMPNAGLMAPAAACAIPTPHHHTAKAGKLICAVQDTHCNLHRIIVMFLQLDEDSKSRSVTLALRQRSWALAMCVTCGSSLVSRYCTIHYTKGTSCSRSRGAFSSKCDSMRIGASVSTF